MTQENLRDAARTGIANYDNGESPKRVIDDIVRRARPDAHIILFANEKGGVGKSTLAFNTAVRLSNRGHRVLAVDLDRRQRSLSRSIENRHGTAVCLGLDLPTPRVCAPSLPSTAMLLQEIMRVGNQCDIIVIDAPGHDNPVVRRAMAIADTIVTPVNASFFDLDMLAHFDPVSQEIRSPAMFARTVLDLREELARREMRKPDWIVAKNRIRGSETSQLARTDAQLNRIAEHFDLRVVDGLRERVGYRGLLQYGLVETDLKSIPQMQGVRLRHTGEMDHLIDDLRISRSGLQVALAPIRRYAAKVCAQTREDFARSLRNHLALPAEAAYA